MPVTTSMPSSQEVMTSGPSTRAKPSSRVVNRSAPISASAQAVIQSGHVSKRGAPCVTTTSSTRRREVRPPTRRPLSSTTTSKPWSASRRAAVAPARPAPTTTMGCSVEEAGWSVKARYRSMSRRLMWVRGSRCRTNPRMGAGGWKGRSNKPWHH